MRPLTDDETKKLFLKLSEYIGKNVERLIQRSDGQYCFRLLPNNRVYYVSSKVLALATSLPSDSLLHLGTCLGKFTKSGQFRLGITALEQLAPYASYKVWVNAKAELSFLYGHHVTKSGLARMTEGTPQYGGVIVYSSSGDVPLGFGVAAQTAERVAGLDPLGTVVLHQADIGDYLRTVEDDMV